MADVKPPGPNSNTPPVQNHKSKLLGNDEDKIDISQLPEMSVEDVDSFLAEEAPDFYKEVSNIGADKTLSFQQIEIDDTAAALHAEIDIWKSYKGPLRALYLILPFLPRVTLKIKFWKFKISGWLQGLWIRIRNFAIFLMTDGRVTASEKLKSQWIKARGNAGQSMETFRKISLKVRLILLFSLFLVVASGGVIYQSVTHGLLPAEKEIFLTGIANHATEAFEYDPKKVEPYIENARAAQNLLLTQKFFVNLKPSSGSGANPMGAFEFFIEGMTSDVVVEAKDREPKIRDLMSTVISEMTYDELDTEDGKRLLCTHLQKEISRVLTTGSVKSVRIKSIVIKP